MKRFPPIDPASIAQHPQLVASLPDEPSSNANEPEKNWSFLIIDDYLLIARSYFKRPNAFLQEQEGRWMHEQIELPKQGLSWFLQVIHTFGQGGYPKGQLGDETTINGERLAVRAVVHYGKAAYTLSTPDRQTNAEGQPIRSSFHFTDTLLFEHGLMDMLENIAAKIKAGVL